MTATDAVSESTRPVPAWVPATAVAGTVLIALGAFWLSFTALADLAERSGIDPRRAWVWPLIVDGVIVVATVSVVALDQFGPRSTRYPWLLLAAAATISVTANALHALYSTTPSVPQILAAAVSAIPPLVLLAITHLTVALTRHTHARLDANEPRRIGNGPAPPSQLGQPDEVDPNDPPRSTVSGRDRRMRRPHHEDDVRVEATRLHGRGWTNRRIAAQLGVHPSTIGRWLAQAPRNRRATTADPGPGPGAEAPPATARAPPHLRW